MKKAFLILLLCAYSVFGITAGSYTVGNGGDYSTWALAYAALANLTGDLTFTQISDVTETAVSAITEDLNGHNFINTSNYSHNGDPNSGWLITMNYDGKFMVIDGDGGGTYTIHDLHVYRADANINIEFDINAATNAYTLNIYNMLVDGADGTRSNAFDINPSTQTINMWNCLIWDCRRALYVQAVGGGLIIENVSAYNSGGAGMSAIDLNSTATTMRNCFAFGSTGDDYNDLSAATGANNAASDTTVQDANWGSGSNNLTELTPTTECVSISDASANLLRSAVGGSCDDGGTTCGIAANTTGIRGNADGRDGATPSIGADEYSVLISSGSYDIGSGGDYTTFYDAFRDITTQTGNITLTQISDVTETYSCALTHTLSGDTLTITSDTPHNGNPVMGWTMTLDHTEVTGFDLQMEGPGVVVIENLQVIRGQTTAGSKMIGYTNVSTLCTLNVHDNLFDGDSKGSNCFYMEDATCIPRIYNNIIYDFNSSGYTQTVNYSGSLIENNTITGCSIGFDLVGQRAFLYNNYVNATTAGRSFFRHGTDGRGYNNASTDTSAANANWAYGSGNVSEVVEGDEFISVATDDFNYFKPKDGSIDSGGTTPQIAENTTDIKGRARPQGTNYSIGAAEYDASDSIIYTVGIGGDFAMWSTGFDILPATLTGDITYLQISDVTETASTGTETNITTSGYTVRLNSDTPHQGDNTAGWLTTFNNAENFMAAQWQGTGWIEICNLRWKRGTAGSNNNKAFYLQVSNQSCSLNIHDNLIDGDDKDGSGIYLNTANTYAQCYNNVVWDCNGNGTVINNDISFLENETFYSCGTGVDASSNTSEFRSILAADNTTDFTNTGSATGYNCASADATAGNGNWSTGSGNVTSITIANEVESTTDTDATFMRVKCGGSADDGGTTPSLAANTTGIGTNPRPHNTSLYSIGAWELFFAISGTTWTDTTYKDSICVGITGYFQRTRIDSGRVDSICGLDTTELVTAREANENVLDVIGLCGAALEGWIRDWKGRWKAGWKSKFK